MIQRSFKECGADVRAYIANQPKVANSPDLCHVDLVDYLRLGKVDSPDGAVPITRLLKWTPDQSDGITSPGPRITQISSQVELSNPTELPAIEPSGWNL